jgi:hypothetical protein
MARQPMSFTEVTPMADLDLSPVPNIKGADGAAAWITEALGIPVTPRYIASQTNARALGYALIAGARYYSTRALYEFIMSKTKTTGATA